MRNKHFFAALLLAAVSSSNAGSTREISKPDAAEIYSLFLRTWNDGGKRSLNVSNSAEIADKEAQSEYSSCLKQPKNKSSNWSRGNAIDDLTETLKSEKFVHLIDTKKWNPDDPQDRISKGESIESSVDAGFKGGLMRLSAISLDEAGTKAAFTYTFVCGGLCGNGGAVIFEKTSSGWTQSKQQCSLWMS